MLDHSTFWRTAARRMRRKINAAIWLDRAATPMVVSAAISAAAVLLARHYWPQATTPWLWLIATGPTLLAAIVAYIIYRREFISSMQSLIRLEHHHQLNSALSAAHEGIAPWPAAPNERKDGLKWAWPRVLAPTALTIILVIAALFFPMPPRIAQPAISILGLLKGLDTHADSLDLSSRLMTVTATILTVTLLLLFAGSVGPYALPRPRRILFRSCTFCVPKSKTMLL